VRGTLTGIAVGVVSGLVLALALALTTDFAATAGEVVACVLLGAWIAGTAGAFVGLARAGTFSDAWARTFEDLVPGPVWLGVRCHDATEQAHAVRVLRREGAGDVTETHDHAG
jgi:hypothetical protein